MNGKITWLKSILLLSLLSTTFYAYAEDAKPAKQATTAAPVDRPNQEENGEGQQMEPEVTIIRKEEKTVEEYRVHGQFYMAKITPSIGKPYYLIDADGDGSLETKRFDLDADFAIPSWVILTW